MKGSMAVLTVVKLPTSTYSTFTILSRPRSRCYHYLLFPSSSHLNISPNLVIISKSSQFTRSFSSVHSFISSHFDYCNSILSNCGFLKYNCPFNSRGVMTSETTAKQKDHLEVTKDQCRSSSAHEVVVESMNELSPTVKELKLRVKVNEGHGQDQNEFSFLPGQWLDVFIPGVKTVGGFSITSSPKQLVTSGIIDLAVKYSEWPPAHWVHTKCTAGSLLNIRSGGDFTLPSDPKGGLVFVAGGVGINPIASMIFHLHDIQYKFPIKLLYSAKTVQELIFKDRFDSLQTAMDNLHVEYYVTSSSAFIEKTNDPSQLQPHGRRMTQEDIAKSITASNDTPTLFVCGPPPLIQLTMTTATTINESQSQGQDIQVIFEKWWM